VSGEIRLTRELLHSAGNSGCGFTVAQVESLGLEYKKGWLSSMVGKTVTTEQWERFMSLRKPVQQKLLPVDLFQSKL